MDRSAHNIMTLFAQLGLDNDQRSINNFIQSHQGLKGTTCLSEASFWSPSQASFIKEAINDDSDWSEVVDQLDTLLRIN